MRFRYLLALAVLALGASCPPPKPPPPPPAPATRAIAAVVSDETGLLAGVAAGLQPLGQAGTTNENGYVLFDHVPIGSDQTLAVTAEGHYPYAGAYRIEADTQDLRVALTSTHFDPSTLSLAQIAAVRGAMWPQTLGACGNLSLGPRPGQPSNIIGTVFIADYPQVEQDCIRAENVRRGYTHVVAGPFRDSDGYHGMWAANDWTSSQAQWDRFLDRLQADYDAHLIPAVFGGWDNMDPDDMMRVMTPLLQQPRAQKLIRLFGPGGWEPTRYGWSSCTWAKLARWARETLPNALVFIHTVTDVDAPAGTDGLCNDDDHSWNPDGNAGAWRRVAPYLHLWFAQSAAFADPDGHGDPNHPDKTNFDNWQDNWRCSVSYSYCNRFHNGYAGWPTTSAWSTGPIRLIAAEFSAYWRFWHGRSEEESTRWGNAAMCAGADGYLDGGSVSVPLLDESECN